MRMELAMDEAGLELIEQLKLLTGLKTNKEFFNNAVTLFDWAVLQVMVGRTLVSLDEEKTKANELVMPSLQYAGRLDRAIKIKALAKRSAEIREKNTTKAGAAAGV
jgi:hypothetical protein